MNLRQEKFVDEYLITGGNASEAARKAGYSAKSARQIGDHLLTKVDIRQAISERISEMRSDKIATMQEVLEHLTAVIRGEIFETIITPGGLKFVVPVRESDRLSAAEKLLRVFGAYREKIDVKVDSASLFVETLQRVWEKSDDKRTTA